MIKYPPCFKTLCNGADGIIMFTSGSEITKAGKKIKQRSHNNLPEMANAYRAGKNAGLSVSSSFAAAIEAAERSIPVTSKPISARCFAMTAFTTGNIEHQQNQAWVGR